MLDIVVRANGHLTVADYRRDGALMRIRAFDSWGQLFAEWGPRWSIANDRACRVTAAVLGGRHVFVVGVGVNPRMAS